MANNEAAPDPVVETGIATDLERENLQQKFERWEKALVLRWSEWQQEARLDFDFAAGRQWSEDEMLRIEDNGRIPVVFNLAAPTIDAVSGAEIQNRQQTQYFPREVGDTGVSDALSQGAEYLTDESNGDQEDSEAFRDVLICGLGVVHYVPETEGDQVRIMKEAVDPLRVRFDASSKRACYEDARYLCVDHPMSWDDFEDFRDEIGRPDLEGYDNGVAGKRVTIVDPRVRYTNGMLGSDDEVVVREWEWWEKEPVRLVAIPQEDGTTSLQKLDDEQFKLAQQLAQQVGITLKHGETTQKVYYRAWECMGEIVKTEKISAFTYKAITGKRDRRKQTFYGLMRPMRDPQRFTNKLYSEIMHIVGTNAKGGVMAEEGAVDDVRQFEESWAQSDAITWVKNGALANQSGPRITPKVPPPVPQALFPMMEFAKSMVRECTGVNEEILGLVAREQAGVLEHQRKQAAYGILSPFFDALRRYRRDSGRLLLLMMREYLPADKLIRVVDAGTAKYVPLAETLEAQEYDVIVDEAPSGPNQKARVMAVITPMMPWLAEAGLDDEFWSKFAQYTDLPAAVANEIAEAFKRKAEAQAAEAEAAKPMQELQQRGMMAEVAKTESEARKNDASAEDYQAKAMASVVKAVNPPEPEPRNLNE